MQFFDIASTVNYQPLKSIFVVGLAYESSHGIQLSYDAHGVPVYEKRSEHSTLFHDRSFKNKRIGLDWLINGIGPSEEKRSTEGPSGNPPQYPPTLGSSWAAYWDNLDPIEASDFDASDFGLLEH